MKSMATDRKGTEMRTLRTMTSLALVVLLALPAAAQDCTEVTIIHGDLSPQITEHVPSEGVYTSIVGHFLWVHVGDEAPEVGNEEHATVSVDVSDPTITGATICPDGNVTLHRAEPEPVEDEVAPLPEVTGLDETVDLAEVFADYLPFIDAIARYRPF